MLTRPFTACGLEPRELLRRGVLQHPGEVLLRRGISQHLLLLRDEVTVSPLRDDRLRSFSQEQALVAVVELGAEHRPAPTVEHGVMEAEDELEALVGAPEDVYVEERAAPPVEDMPLAPLRPFREVELLLFLGLTAQIFDLQRQIDTSVHDLQWPLAVEQKTGAQDG